MRIMRFGDSRDASNLIADKAPLPNPAPAEILVRVHAAGVTPTESQWSPTTHTQDGAIRTGAIPGHEFSGVIEAVGVNVDPKQIGREVYGMNDWFADGATADCCVSVLEAVADRPPRLIIWRLRASRLAPSLRGKDCSTKRNRAGVSASSCTADLARSVFSRFNSLDEPART
jgi:Alcohol dehydrogenase GroES-like domain